MVSWKKCAGCVHEPEPPMFKCCKFKCCMFNSDKLSASNSSKGEFVKTAHVLTVSTDQNAELHVQYSINKDNTEKCYL